MPAIITADQFQAHQPDHVGVPNLERDGQRGARVILVSAYGPDHGTAQRSTIAWPSDPMDELQMATWEDAEWQ